MRLTIAAAATRERAASAGAPAHTRTHHQCMLGVYLQSVCIPAADCCRCRCCLTACSLTSRRSPVCCCCCCCCCSATAVPLASHMQQASGLAPDSLFSLQQSPLIQRLRRSMEASQRRSDEPPAVAQAAALVTSDVEAAMSSPAAAAPAATEQHAQQSHDAGADTAKPAAAAHASQSANSNNAALPLMLGSASTHSRCCACSRS
jgi:hypothetical protein